MGSDTRADALVLSEIPCSERIHAMVTKEGWVAVMILYFFRLHRRWFVPAVLARRRTWERQIISTRRSLVGVLGSFRASRSSEDQSRLRTYDLAADGETGRIGYVD